MAVLVKTTSGAVEGAREDGLCVFRGVAFARPPIGRLRFAPPEPPGAWTGVRPARDFAPAPPQPREPLVQELGLLGEHAQSEDCLYLNVWTPAADAARRPVLLWLHGGSFTTGTGAAPIYDGARLARTGDAVVVTLNYRVGALGFLCLGTRVPRGGVRANFGLLDQVRALEWVRDEIARFGGDPERVTVFGESAGAGSLLALMTMPAARGLFRRAIVQSAAPAGMLPLAEANARAELLIAALDAPAPDLAALRALPLDALLAAQAHTLAAGPWDGGMLFQPVIDGHTLPHPPLDVLRDGEAHDVDLIIGTTAEELRLFARDAFFRALDDDLLGRVLAARLPGADADGRSRAQRLLETYRSARSARAEGIAALDLFCAIESDRSMRVPSAELAAAHARAGRSVYMYLFTWRSPLEDGLLGACHALDLPFVFGTLDAKGMSEFAGAGPEAERLSRAMMHSWLAFAREGDPTRAPTPATVASWPRYDAERRATLELGATVRVVDAPGERERAVWAALEDEHA